MPCQLRPYPGIRVFTAPTGANVMMYIGSASGLAKLTAVTLNGNPLAITDDLTFFFTMGSGIDVVRITVVSPNAGDTIQVFEDCGGGQNQKIDEYPYDSNDPVRGYRIVGN